MQPLKPALQSSQGRSSDWGGARLINCYAERADGDQRSDFAVLGIPGLTELGDIGSGPIRGMHYLAGVLYVVSGGSLYSVTSAGVETLRGAVAGTGRVRMASNYTQLCIAASTGTGYVYSAGALTAPLAFSVSDVIYVDGYMLWVVQNSEQFFISALDDALTYDAADIASVEGFPDNIVGVVNDHREIVFAGGNTTEIFYNSGAVAFPFERQGNAFIERGCFDRDSIVKADGSVIFMGDDRIVYTLQGYQPVRISTHAVEYRLRNATYARALSYASEGHHFYCLEHDNGTEVYDRSTGAWHERASYGATHWRVGGAIEAYGGLLFSDRATGELYTPSNDVFTEDGETLPFDIYLPTIEAGRERVSMYAFEVVCDTGVGNGDVAEPMVMLRYSDDGGHLWSNEMWRSLGAIGVHRTRAVWRKLGQFRQRQMHLRITDAARRLVIGFYIDAG